MENVFQYFTLFNQQLTNDLQNILSAALKILGIRIVDVSCTQIIFEKNSEFRYCLIGFDHQSTVLGTCLSISKFDLNLADTSSVSIVTSFALAATSMCGQFLNAFTPDETKF